MLAGYKSTHVMDIRFNKPQHSSLAVLMSKLPSFIPFLLLSRINVHFLQFLIPLTFFLKKVRICYFINWK
ncbi:hypothetical protein CWS02_16040 [Enterobacter sp. EA-1]|nr:hypothetical protein CWS02_16040 [Enterobacter sp. EA-1]